MKALVTTSAKALVSEFEETAHALLSEASGDALNTYTRQALRMRGEAWASAAAKLREQLPWIEEDAAREAVLA